MRKKIYYLKRWPRKIPIYSPWFKLDFCSDIRCVKFDKYWKTFSTITNCCLVSYWSESSSFKCWPIHPFLYQQTQHEEDKTLSGKRRIAELRNHIFKIVDEWKQSCSAEFRYWPIHFSLHIKSTVHCAFKHLFLKLKVICNLDIFKLIMREK